MNPRFRCGVALVLLVPLWGCVPLTFSREAAIDFEAYPHVAVQVSLHGKQASYIDVNPTDYLASQLRAGSGFETVSEGTNAAADLTLDVHVTVTFEGSWQFLGAARFTAVNRSGTLIDESEIRDRTYFIWEGSTEATEDVLDEVALHYLDPYRL